MNETNKYIKRGYFWLPENSNNRQLGTLTINYGGNIELDLMGSLGGKFRRFTQMDETSEYFDVNGLIEDDGEVALKDCLITNSKFTTKHNFETHKLLANIALIGDESLQSDSYQLFKFTVDNLNVWMGKSGIKTEFMNSESNAIISYVCPKNISIKLLTDFKLELLYQPSYSMSFTNTEDNFIKENIYLVLTSNNSKPIEEFRLLASRIVNFFSFSMDLFLYIDDINILSDINFKDNLTFKNTKVYYNNYPSETAESRS